jgi:hypothetical protein
MKAYIPVVPPNEGNVFAIPDKQCWQQSVRAFDGTHSRIVVVVEAPFGDVVGQGYKCFYPQISKKVAGIASSLPNWSHQTFFGALITSPFTSFVPSLSLSSSSFSPYRTLLLF